MNILLIRQKMIQRGLTQEHVARACGMNKLAIHRILSSQVKNPHKDTITAIADYFQVSPLELIDNKAEISKRKLLKFMVTRYRENASYDYFIFRNAKKLEAKDVKDLVMHYGVELPNIALEPDETNRIEFDESKLLLHVVENQLDIEEVYRCKDLALRKITDFNKYSRIHLKRRPSEACNLLKDKQKSEKLYIYPHVIKILARCRGLEIKDLEKQLQKETGFDVLLDVIESRPLEGASDAKVIKALIDILNTKATALLCPEWLI